MMDIKIYLILKITFSAMVLLLVAGIIIWSVRKGTFHSDSHASKLPLEIEDDKNEKIN